MTKSTFFSDINFLSIVDTVKGIYTSDGSISTLLDFERVLDEADLYAFKNWEIGELVQGPIVGRYDTSCIFMWHHKHMPDPRGGLRLTKIGCDVEMAKGTIQIPATVKTEDDFRGGTHYPKLVDTQVWFVKITIPLELMDDIKAGSIELADNIIDLSDIDDAYSEDLDDNTTGDTDDEGGL